jgi:methyl-accepting chemotaxis protein
LRAFNGLLDSTMKPVSDLHSAIQTMTREHERGEIDAVIDRQRFRGDLALLSDNINDLVGAHIAVKKKAMACVKALGEGDFNAPLEQFPGKKAFINDTIEALRGNLTGLTAEMNHMSDEHNKGDIDVFVQTEKFQGDFAIMAKGINDMVAGHIAVKKKRWPVSRRWARAISTRRSSNSPAKRPSSTTRSKRCAKTCGTSLRNSSPDRRVFGRSFA